MTAALFDDPNMEYWAYRLGVLDSEDEVRKIFRHQFNEIVENPAADILLLSSEIVSDYNPKKLQKLRTRLLAHAEELEVIALVRSPLSSIESILQQRAYGGGTEDEMASIVGKVTRRFKRLQSVFANELEVIDFHQEQAREGGLVAAFFDKIGIPESVVSSLEFQRSNERISSEAYKLMDAINRLYPTSAEPEEGFERKFHDLKPLTTLPGSRFRIGDFKQTRWYADALREDADLAKEYGFNFPEYNELGAAPLWGDDTLLALEDAICKLESSEFRLASADALDAAALEITESDPNRAAILNFISQKVRQGKDLPTQYLLDEIGADYFKFAALQLGPESPKLALYLMSLARKLRPGANFIEERITHYRKKLGLD